MHVRTSMISRLRDRIRLGLAICDFPGKNSLCFTGIILGKSIYRFARSDAISGLIDQHTCCILHESYMIRPVYPTDTIAPFFPSLVNFPLSSRNIKSLSRGHRDTRKEYVAIVTHDVLRKLACITIHYALLINTYP